VSDSSKQKFLGDILIATNKDMQSGGGHMTVNTQKSFDLHLKWFKAKADGDNVGAKAAFDALARLGLNPEKFSMSPANLEKELVKFEQLRLNHQYHLSTISNYTLIGPKIPGGLSETSASLLRASKGRGRKGQSGGNKSTENDLANNEEVKEAARTFNQIDLVVAGKIVMVGTRQWLKIDESKTDPRFLNQLNGKESRVTNQFSKNASSVQPLEQIDGKLHHIPNDLGITVGKRAKGLQRIVFKIKGGQPMGWDTDTKSFILDGERPWDGNQLTAKDLKNLCRENDLPVGGKKPQLIERLDGKVNTHTDGLYIQIGEDTPKYGIKTVKNDDAKWFRICMERPHFNLGKKNNADFRAMTESGINFVSRHMDAAGRPAVAFCHLKLDSEEAHRIVGLQDRSEGEKYQWQPYLFNDNTRRELYTGNKSLKEMGARILLYLVETQPGKIEAVYSALDEGQPSGALLSEPRIEKMLCEVDPDTRFPLRHHLPITFKDGTKFDYANAGHRKCILLHHCQTMAKYYRDSRVWTDLTNTARSVLSGKDGEQLSALFSGLRGDRSMARGDDLVENDDEPSEVKHISGANGDAAFTIDPSGTIHLGGSGDITSQKRLFVSWMEDKGKVGDSKLHMKVLVTDKKLKKLLDAQHDAYYGTKHVDKRDARDKDDAAEYRDDLQYHSQPYETSKIGKGKRKYMPEDGVLDFSKLIAFEFIEGASDFKFYDASLVTF
jgi:hypothetical protein